MHSGHGAKELGPKTSQSCLACEIPYHLELTGLLYAPHRSASNMGRAVGVTINPKA